MHQKLINKLTYKFELVNRRNNCLKLFGMIKSATSLMKKEAADDSSECDVCEIGKPFLTRLD
jgi:hypothetical protein